jgi:hypothetical protein
MLRAALRLEGPPRGTTIAMTLSMRFMSIIKATGDSKAGVMPDEALTGAMAAYHDALTKAGVLRDDSGFKPTSRGRRIRYDGEKRSFDDGPFAETKELIAGHTIIQVKSKREAIDWSMSYPNPAGAGRPAEIEVREFFEFDDFAPGTAVDKFPKMGVASCE